MKFLRLRLRLRGISLNRIAEKVNGYLSSCVPVGRGRKPGYFKQKKSGKLSVLKLRTNNERERKRELEIGKVHA